MAAPTTLDDLVGAGVIAVLRAPDAALAVQAADALVDGGVTGIEVTYTIPGAADVIGEVRRRHGDRVLLGAGTVTEAGQATEATEAGATFLVSPGSDPEVAAAMRATGGAVLLGALTPTEVLTALRLGSVAVKLFPAVLGGPAYLKALRGPFPEVPMIPTGGVSADNLADWFAAGASAVGAGSELCPPRAIAERRWDELRERAGVFTSALATVPGRA